MLSYIFLNLEYPGLFFNSKLIQICEATKIYLIKGKITNSQNDVPI